MTTASAEPIDPAKAALVLMDFQSGLLGRFPEADELLATARDTIALARERGVAIGYVRIAFAEGEAPGGRMGRMITPELLASVQDDSPNTQIHNDVSPEPNDIVVRKVRVGPFGTTDLDAQLRAQGVDTLLVAGVTTSGVVLTAVRDAHDRDYRVMVLSDLTADPDPEMHEFLLTRLFPQQAEVIPTADLLGLLA